MIHSCTALKLIVDARSGCFEARFHSIWKETSF